VTTGDAGGEDDPLVQRLRAGEVAAFDEAYARYHGRLFAFLARMTGRRDLAEDLLQETWLRLASHGLDLRRDTRLEAWLFTVARNLSLSFLRWRVLDGRRRGAAVLVAVVEGGAVAGAPFDEAAAAQTAERLEAALAALPPRYREVMLLVGVEGLEPHIAAQVLGLRPDAVRQRLLRARDMLKRSLADEGPARAAPADRKEAE
jgi:RNA polymerase sigma-70 factor (ECF subfamily)